MLKILEKLHAIMSEVDYIQKDKKNTFFNYTYASEKAIKEALHGLLVKHKVVFTIDVLGSNKSPITTAKGNTSFVTDAKVAYTFWDVDSGESLKGEFIGTGEDASDKGTYKAITGAIKYILTTTFLIPTGDDAEADDGEDKKPPQTQQKPVQHTTAQGHGTCKDCGASNAWSQAKQKPYCSAKCWLEPKNAPLPVIKVEERERQEWKPPVIDDGDVPLDSIPF